MKNIWVYKFDGTFQCDETAKEIPLEEMKGELAEIIGERNILNSEKRFIPQPEMCGLPTGAVNAYHITPEGRYLLFNGFVGPRGFMLWPSDEEGTLSQKQRVGRSILDIPTTVKGLIGRPLRAYKTGDALAQDWRPERVNIETDESGIIVDIWFG